jgi:hypothetical protein
MIKYIKKYKIQILLIILVLFVCFITYKTIDTFVCRVNSRDLYKRLMDDFDTIFPDRNRNGGGPQFYHHIVQNINPSYEEFLEYNKFYCGVSGSPIDATRKDRSNPVVIKHVDYENNNLKLFGHYYRCCWPCVCDIIKYARAEESEYKGQKIYILTIDDPCSNESEIPKEVSCYQCNNGKTENGIHTKSGRLIFALLHDAEPYDETNGMMKHVTELEDMCKERNNQLPDELQGGMGDIFVKLSLVGKKKKPKHDTLKNIYGEPLQSCQVNNSINNQGSWDLEGFCSERGGGVHQICFKVEDDTANFSTETGQSDWSSGRVGNNHCMCLGAWALYKAKEKGNDRELVCESIPDMALSTEYVSNWNTWNGNELSNQIVNGVDSLVKQCYRKKNSEYLKNKYNNLREHYGGDWDSVI